ncbi:MAG TPA: crossover junction endodeoxyribonuclease RuvC [Acidimicrobiales bacterium]|jgi:crossover junction endodeoxyribonuclease RuvC|nr:crossover junction endodeoxyribonuclease RuvC [Acidimicrobiales bacterium]
MFVLGVDPGLSRCGYGCIESRAGRHQAVAVGVLRTDPSRPVPDRLAELQGELRDLFRELQPSVVAIERVFFQHNVRTAMSVGQASGLAMVEAVAIGAEVVEYSPNEVKLAVAGDGRASKAEVQAMVQHLLGLATPPKPADAADACALALCHLAHAGLRRRVAAAGGSR